MQQTNVLEYLEKTAPRFPDKMAFSNGDESLTFSQLYRNSRAIGSFLASEGYGSEPIVIFMDKHPNCISSFFGCIYSGCHYVPIDKEMPPFRIDLILKTIQPRIMLCDSATIGLAKRIDFNGRILLYDEIVCSPVNEPLLVNVRRQQIDTDPVYVVFTSGSTGIPKGVVACHRSIIDYIENLSESLNFSENTVFANQSPFYFDACLKEIYSTIKWGCSTYIVPQNLFLFPAKLVQYLNRHKINTICWVSSALAMISSLHTFDTIIPQHLHTVAFGSEIFPIKQLKIWQKALPNAHFTNLYGPTECTGMSCCYRVDRDFELDDVIPIGKPFRNTQILLLDEDGHLVPDGYVGEICIRGTCLAMGYYRNSAQTHQAFTQNPLHDRYPELIYHTGDLGKRNSRGELVFVSRKDHQIKHMGHRIELAEIELAVGALDDVQNCCCIYDKANDKIIAYYAGKPSAAELITQLRAKLPRYMMPNKVFQLDTIPCTPNGKADRKLLENYKTQ